LRRPASPHGSPVPREGELLDSGPLAGGDPTSSTLDELVRSLLADPALLRLYERLTRAE
jgi:hypothetical protein